jgi:hypothetical protein
MREKATKDRPTMNPAKTGIFRLLIASAIDPDVYRRLQESPVSAISLGHCPDLASVAQQVESWPSRAAA